LVPFSDRVSISQKETKKKEKNVEKFVQSIKPKGFGVIVRTVAEGKNTAELKKICRTCSADGLQCVKYQLLIIRQSIRRTQQSFF
jgi:Ribonuclease G/E